MTAALRLVPPLPPGPAAPVDPELIREQLERLAYWSLNGRVRDTELPRLLASLSPLPETDAMQWFADLETAVALAVHVERGHRTFDGEHTEFAARKEIDLALDALQGDPR